MEHGTNSAKRLASTVLACMGSTLMTTKLAAIASARSPACTWVVEVVALVMPSALTTVQCCHRIRHAMPCSGSTVACIIDAFADNSSDSTGGNKRCT